jgi:hypothetical protein
VAAVQQRANTQLKNSPVGQLMRAEAYTMSGGKEENRIPILAKIIFRQAQDDFCGSVPSKPARNRPSTGFA